MKNGDKIIVNYNKGVNIMKCLKRTLIICIVSVLVISNLKEVGISDKVVKPYEKESVVFI